MFFWRNILLLIALIFAQNTFAQEIAIGQWRDHLPYNRCIALAEAGDKIYCATQYGIFYYNRTDNSTQRFTKVEGLSDVGISAISYNKKHEALLITYSNANIDLFIHNNVINISDIKRKQILGNKAINNILFIDQLAYLSCGFGIVVLDIAKQEIKDTYYVGDSGNALNVYDLTFSGNKFLAATEKGVYISKPNSINLADYNSWYRDTLLPRPTAKYNLIETVNGNVYVNNANNTWSTDTMFIYNGSAWRYFNPTYSSNRKNITFSYGKIVIANIGEVDVFNTSDSLLQHIWTYNPGTPSPMDAIFDSDGQIWIADNGEGLVKCWSEWGYEKIKLNGPYSANVSAMDVQDQDLWVAPGGHNDAWGPIWLQDGVFSFVDNAWVNYNKLTIPALDTIKDIINVAINPFNKAQVFACSWGYGLLEFNDGVLTNIYNQDNSSLQAVYGTICRVGGAAFDDKGNLWMTNSLTSNSLSVKKTSGSWQAFSFSPLVNGDEIGGLIVDSYNQKWIILPRNNEIIVFDNSSGTEQKKILDPNKGNDFATHAVNCLVEDNEGEMWLGTDLGIKVFYSPENALIDNDYHAETILVEQDGHVQHLFETENILALAVDGANQKWVGTEKSGVFLMSADGTEQLLHFTAENSPLLSNAVSSIAINQKTGEIFFGTDKGIISYKGTATGGDEAFTDVLVYPNPVRENYNGLIAIKGLVTDADVKITDINGVLIYQTKAQGGQATWNGKNFEGRKASTGVYLVFSTNDDGSETLVTKILFIN